MPFNDVSPQTVPEFWADMDTFRMDFSLPHEINPHWTLSYEERESRVKKQQARFRSRQITVIDDFQQRVVEWDKPSETDAEMSKAKYFLYLLYSDIQSLINKQTYDFIKEHVDAITRHDMESVYNFAGSAIALG